MAEPVTQQGTQNGTATQQPSGQAGGQPSGQQQQAAQEPQWLSKLTDEAERKEAREGWLRDADYRRKTMEIADRQKSWETERADLQKRVDEYNAFSQAYQPFYQRLQAKWDQIAPILEGRQPTPTAQPSSPQSSDFENWDVLPATEQAKKLAEHVGTNYVAQAIAQLKQEFNQALAQREQYYTNYLNILTDAFERGRKDPNLNLSEFMQKANSIQYGKENPLELAYSAVTSERTRKALEEEAYNRGKQDALLEAQNKQQTNGALQSQTIPVFRQKPMTREQVSEAARQTAIGKGLPW